MSQIVSYINANGEIDSPYGKISYSLALDPIKQMPQEILELMNSDVQDFEMYLIEKYSMHSEPSKLDPFQIWKKIKKAFSAKKL